MTDGGDRGLDLDPIAVVEAWRARDGTRVDPVTFAVIEALARRAAAQEGEARRLLVRRVEALLVEHTGASYPSTQAHIAPDEAAARRGALAGLSQLVDRLGRSPAAQALPSSPPRPGAGSPCDAPLAGPASLTAPLRSLKAVTVFKGTWSRLRAEHRLRQALAHVPALAGPLHSSHVVNRALQAMRDLSPAYLDAFMSHIDTLQWLEQASGAPDNRPVTPVERKRRPGAPSSARKA